MKRLANIVLGWLVLGAGGLAASAAEPWPAEPNTAAAKLTGIDSGLNAVNWSGAFWNPDTRTLWLACNSGYFWALVEDGAGSFKVATNSAGAKAKWSPGGDFEAICQANSSTNLVYVMDENGYVREYDVSNYAATNATHTWNIISICPEAGGASGGEGIAFVPDEYLRRQRFCNSNGVPYASTNGMGGLVFVGYQADGYVYAFDLNRANNTYGYIGRYKTGRTETADLYFDRATGQLHVWHNTGSNYLEMVELHSVLDGADRRLRQLAEYVGPRTGNLEGFAVVPSAASADGGGCILTDDDNSGGEAITWYRQFEPSADTDSDGLADGVELWHFGTTTQTVGAADADGDHMSNADEIVAGTDPTNQTSALVQSVPASDNQELVLSWPSAPGRTYAIHSASILEVGFTNVVQTGISAIDPLNVVTVDVSALADFRFYRISVEAP